MINQLPTGAIVAFGGTGAIPNGWLLCNGDRYDRNDPLYQDLYNVIKSTWGDQDDPYFKVPDLNGLFLRATEDRFEVGKSGGALIVTSDPAVEDQFTDTYDGSTGDGGSPRVPGLSHRHNVKIEPPYAYVYYIIKL